MKKQVKAPSGLEIELRRWCVEMAIRWPCFEDNVYGNGQGFQQYDQLSINQKVRTDADIIGRAERLLKWVNARA